MDPRAEGHVPVVGPVEDDLSGMLERLGIAVGPREVHQHLVSRLHRTPPELDVLGDHPAHGHRCVRPQQLLEGQGHGLGVGGQHLGVLGMGGQVPQGGADGAPRGVHPGDEDQSGDAEHDALLDGCAVDPAVEQLTQQVVPRLGPAAGHLVDEVGDQLLHAPATALGVVGELEEVPHPAGEGVGQLDRHPEDGGDDPDRYLLGVPGGGVDRSVGHEAVDQSGAELPGHGLVGLDAAVREPRQEEPAGPGVQGRVGRDRREPVGEDRLVGGLDVVLDHRDDRGLGRAEVLDVVGQVHHVLVPGGQPGAPPPVGMGHRAGPAQFVPDAEGILHVLGAQHVEVGVPARHRWCVVHGAPPTDCKRSRRRRQDHLGTRPATAARAVRW